MTHTEKNRKKREREIIKAGKFKIWNWKPVEGHQARGLSVTQERLRLLLCSGLQWMKDYPPYRGKPPLPRPLIYILKGESLSLSCVRLFVTPRNVALSLWDSPGKNTWVGCHFLIQGIFLIQWYNWHLLLVRLTSPVSHQGSPSHSKTSLEKYMEFDQLSGHPVPVKMTPKSSMLPSSTLTNYGKKVTRKEVYLTYIPCNQ